MVTLWHMKLETTQVYDVVQTSPGPMQAHTEVAPLSAEFDIDHELMKDPASIEVSYGYNSRLTLGPSDSPAVVKTAAPNDSSSTGSWRTNPARNLRPCDPSLNVSDPGCSDIDNTFNLGVYVEIPVTVTTTPRDKPPTTESTSTGLGVDFFFAYDFTAQTNSDDMTPPGNPYGVFRTMLIIPEGYGTPSVATYKVSYTLTAKQMQLNYFPLTQDARASTNAWGGYSAVTSNLAKSGSSWLLHANNQLQPTVEGEDVSSSFKAWRWVRSWLAGVGVDGTRAAYAGAAAAGAANPTWVYDNGPDDSGEVQPGWFDVPGGPQLPADPSAWATVRQLDEFVATVLNYPEFGLLYYLVVWDVKPNAYRIRMYPAQSITVDQWCSIKASNSPNIDEGSWQPPVADANTSSEMIDTGWTDSSGNPTS